MTKRRATQFVKDALLHTHTLQHEFAVVHGDTFIGRCFLHVTDEKQKAGEIGYLLLPDYWHKGIASQTVARLLTFGFDTLHLKRIFGTCNPKNIYSARVMEKNGMKLEQIIPHHKWVARTKSWRDSMIWAMTRGDWQQTHSK